MTIANALQCQFGPSPASTEIYVLLTPVYVNNNINTTISLKTDCGSNIVTAHITEKFKGTVIGVPSCPNLSKLSVQSDSNGSWFECTNDHKPKDQIVVSIATDIEKYISV